jgi:hypothetical protein
MQNVLIEHPYQYMPPHRGKLLPGLIRDLRLFKRHLRKSEGVVDYEIRHLERLRESMAEGHGMLLAPNHSRTADPMVMAYVCLETPCLLYSMASWHLFNQGLFSRWAIHIMGGFSVNREGIDRQSLDEAINVLYQGERPLVVFPEGTTSRTNDRLMPLLDGVAFMARTAAKRRAKAGAPGSGKVVVHPIAIKYVFNGDVHAACKPVLCKLEHQFAMRPQNDKPLLKRIEQIGESLLSLKELEYFGGIQSGERSLRQQNLINRLLEPLEKQFVPKAESGDGVIARIKAIRMKLLPELTAGNLSTRKRKIYWQYFEDTYLAQQVFCYPDNYLRLPTTVNRVLETVERFEEDVSDRAPVHGKLKAVIEIGEAIPVDPKRDRSSETDPLMEQIRDRLQSRLDCLASLSKPFAESSTVQSHH